MDACRIKVRGDEMINSFLQLIVFVFAVWCLVIVIKAIGDNPDARCQYGNCDECPFPRCRKEMVNNGRIHNRRLPRRMDKTKAV